MSTLPRTRSLSGADTVSLSSKYKERFRPTSLCENSWNRIVSPQSLNNGQHHTPREVRLKRTPSQANSLSTTVPTSLVPRNLGGKRHVPTKTSLKHSRMFNVQQKSKAFMVRRQPSTVGSVGRIGILVLAAQVFVGSAAILLATWLILWTPNLNFRVVPHYAGVPVLLSGIFGSILLCFMSGKRSCGASIIRAIVVCFCCISILTCSCVCVFTSLHLIRLAPMQCSISSTLYPLHLSTNSPFPTPTYRPKLYPTHKPIRDLPKENLEGSGDIPNYLPDSIIHWDEEEDSPDILELPYPDAARELNPHPPPPRFYPGTLTVNRSVCVCEQLKKGWRIVDRYDLSCAEVKNILPIFFVASIVVSSVGAVLCAVIVYMLYISRVPKHRPSEARPFIYKSQFKSNTKGGGGGVNMSSSNGNDTNNSMLYR